MCWTDMVYLSLKNLVTPRGHWELMAKKTTRAGVLRSDDDKKLLHEMLMLAYASQNDKQGNENGRFFLLHFMSTSRPRKFSNPINIRIQTTKRVDKSTSYHISVKLVTLVQRYEVHFSSIYWTGNFKIYSTIVSVIKKGKTDNKTLTNYIFFFERKDIPSTELGISILLKMLANGKRHYELKMLSSEVKKQTRKRQF